MLRKNAALFAFLTATLGGAGLASAATIDFDSGSLSGGVYSQDGFEVVGLNGGNVALPSDCGSQCLRLNNESSGHIYRLTRADGSAFTLSSFTYNGRDGEAPAVDVSSTLFGSVLGGTIYRFNETLNGNQMTATGPLSLFENVTAVYFQSAENGSARIDNLEVTAVPLPAAGFLLLGGLAAIGIARRRG